MGLSGIKHILSVTFFRSLSLVSARSLKGLALANACLKTKVTSEVPGLFSRGGYSTTIEQISFQYVAVTNVDACCSPLNLVVCLPYWAGPKYSPCEEILTTGAGRCAFVNPADLR